MIIVEATRVLEGVVGSPGAAPNAKIADERGSRGAETEVVDVPEETVVIEVPVGIRGGLTRT